MLARGGSWTNSEWAWSPDIASSCGYHTLSQEEAWQLLRGKTVWFAGNSVFRRMLYTVVDILGQGLEQRQDEEYVSRYGREKLYDSNANGLAHTYFKVKMRYGASKMSKPYTCPSFRDGDDFKDISKNLNTEVRRHPTMLFCEAKGRARVNHDTVELQHSYLNSFSLAEAFAQWANASDSSFLHHIGAGADVIVLGETWLPRFADGSLAPSGQPMPVPSEQDVEELVRSVVTVRRRLRDAREGRDPPIFAFFTPLEYEGGDLKEERTQMEAFEAYALPRVAEAGLIPVRVSLSSLEGIASGSLSHQSQWHWHDRGRIFIAQSLLNRLQLEQRERQDGNRPECFSPDAD